MNKHFNTSFVLVMDAVCYMILQDGEEFGILIFAKLGNMLRIYLYTECNRRNGPDLGRVFLRSNYTDITQNTNIQSSMFTEILAREV